MAGQNIDDTHYRRVDCAAGSNLALSLGERLEDFRFLIRDCGSNFTRSFDAVFQAASARISYWPPTQARTNSPLTCRSTWPSTSADDGNQMTALQLRKPACRHPAAWAARQAKPTP
jgi:hypothetical protein